jgi:hypothetical protein
MMMKKVEKLVEGLNWRGKEDAESIPPSRDPGRIHSTRREQRG